MNGISDHIFYNCLPVMKTFKHIGALKIYINIFIPKKILLYPGQELNVASIL